MGKNIYRKLAFRNLKKNATMMLPYFFICVTVVIFYYIVVSLSANKDLKAISGGNFTIDVMKFGSLLFAILSIFFLLYSNSFIMKRRKKELGLYHILGLEKKHIQKVLAWENNICALATIVLGLVFGFIINPFLTAILSRAISAELAFSSAISIVAVAKTVFLFITIFIIIFLFNLRQIHSANSLELLKGGQYGEKEPKTKWSLAIFGAVLLAVGYILSWFVKNPKEDFNLIIGAIVCVLIATYLLFLAVSVVVLKMLRSKEHIYYKPKNFTLISGLLYRIKQNAIGLSNICILATATLFIMTITTSLYFGINNMLNNSYSKDISIIYPQTDKKEMADLKEFIDETTVKYSVTLGNETHYTGNKHAEDFAKNETLEYFFLMPLSDYNRLTGEELTLSHDEVLFYSEGEEYQLDELSFGQNSVRIAEKLKSFPIENDHGDDYGRRWLYVVTQEDGLIAEYFGLSDNVTSYYEFDLLGKEADKTAFSHAIADEVYGFTNWSSMSKYVYRESAIVRFGGLLFLGILISIILFAETALSIFYKQISEGFDDKDRFNILTKVGMSHKEIHSTIRRQILIVFFSPLLVALLHLTIALPMIMKLLKIAFLDSVGVIAGSGLICATVFVLIYSLVFFMTEQAYRKIVTSPQKQEKRYIIVKLKKMSLVIGCILLLIGFISYIVWDNNRVVVDKVTLSSQKLSDSFDGYTILQITDLHGKSFGKDQKALVNLIKKQKYDLVLFTGDYISDDTQDLKPLEDLLKGLPTEKEMFYILGNTDEDNSVATLVSGNRFYDLFIKYGVKPLYPGQEITKNGESIWLKTNPYASAFYEISRDIPQELINAKNEFDAQYKSAVNPFTIEVSHRPTEIDHENELIHDYRTNILNETDKEWIDWDVSINGHTHGGQMVLPFIGPLYAPNHGFMPGKVNVRGVHTENGHTQYICSGLGVSGPAFAKFRLFNTPSIGLITLKKI